MSSVEKTTNGYSDCYQNTATADFLILVAQFASLNFYSPFFKSDFSPHFGCWHLILIAIMMIISRKPEGPIATGNQNKVKRCLSVRSLPRGRVNRIYLGVI